jgi:hypothetical protein
VPAHHLLDQEQDIDFTTIALLISATYPFQQ